MSYHERRSIRLKRYDYRSNAYYYITICTISKDLILGHVKNGNVVLNNFGIIAHREWIKTGRIRTYVELDAFIIMPNHVHGIIVIKGHDHDQCRGMACHAHTKNKQIINRKFGKPIKQSLSTIIGSYKSSVSREINKLRNRPGEIFWQRNYFEHIIRNEHELMAIHKYIINNPGNFNK